MRVCGGVRRWQGAGDKRQVRQVVVGGGAAGRHRNSRSIPRSPPRHSKTTPTNRMYSNTVNGFKDKNMLTIYHPIQTIEAKVIILMFQLNYAVTNCKIYSCKQVSHCSPVSNLSLPLSSLLQVSCSLVSTNPTLVLQQLQLLNTILPSVKLKILVYGM